MDTRLAKARKEKGLLYALLLYPVVAYVDLKRGVWILRKIGKGSWWRGWWKLHSNACRRSARDAVLGVVVGSGLGAFVFLTEKILSEPPAYAPHSMTAIMVPSEPITAKVGSVVAVPVSCIGTDCSQVHWYSENPETASAYKGTVRILSAGSTKVCAQVSPVRVEPRACVSVRGVP